MVNIYWHIPNKEEAVSTKRLYIPKGGSDTFHARTVRGSGAVASKKMEMNDMKKSAMTVVVGGQRFEATAGFMGEPARWIGPIPNTIRGGNDAPLWRNIDPAINEKGDLYDSASGFRLCVINEGRTITWHLGAPVGERSIACIRCGEEALLNGCETVNDLTALNLFKWEAREAMKRVR
ncbi:MAG: hypothetical protein ABIA47_01385 [bacterium]